MSEPRKVYPDKAAFDAELDRPTGVYLKLKVTAQKQGRGLAGAAALAAAQAYAGAVVRLLPA